MLVFVISCERCNEQRTQNAQASEAAKVAVTEVSSALLFTVLFIISKFSLQVLIRVQHQKAFKEEGRRSDCLYGPGRA